MSRPDASPTPVTTTRLQAMKQRGERIVMVTAYDAPSARLADEAGVDLILVGDSVGNTTLGYPSTIQVTLEDILHHTRAVARAARHALVVGDMPFLTFRLGPDETLRNAGRLLQEGGARAVKLEGGTSVAPTVRHLVEAGIPVMGHVGLTPQSINQIGGFRLQGRTPEAADRLRADARALADAGAFAIVLELVPAPLAALITREIPIPTIGIGAGAGCDGQVQVWHDLLGLGERRPRHARQYADVGGIIREALRRYAAEVREGSFPGPEHVAEIPQELQSYLEREGAYADRPRAR